MGYMNWFDYAVILAYLVILLIIGFYLRARASRSLDDYFLAGRSLPWWALGISGMASWLDLTGTMLVTSLLFVMGPKGLLLEFRGGACLVLVFLMVYIGKWQRRSRLMTNAEWMIFRFGDGFGGTFARLSAVLAAIVGTVGMLAYAIKGVGLFLSMFLPYTPIVCAAIMVAVTCIYLVQSGFYGVVVTDVFQSVCILVGVIFIVWLAVSKIAGVDVAALALQVTGQTDWTATIPAWQEKFPKGYEQYDYLTLIVLFFLTKTIFQSMGVTGDNRYFAARDERESGLLAMTSGWSMVMRWPLMMGAALLGLLIIQASFPDQSVLGQAAAVIHQYYAAHGGISENQWYDGLAAIINQPHLFGDLPDKLRAVLGADWQNKLPLVSYHGTVYPERVLPTVLLSSTPTGVRGLIIVAMLAAAMSTFNSTVNVATSFFTRDLYQGYLRRRAGTRELIYVSWLFGALVFAVSFWMAFYAQTINDIWSWITSGLVAGTGAAYFLRWYWWRFNGGGFAASMLAGLVAAVLQRTFFPQLDEFSQFVYILAISLTASIAGTYLTPPTDHEVLKNFYCRTMPFGFWKPYSSLLPAATRQALAREHRNDILAIPFGLAWVTTLNLIPLQLMVKEWLSAAVSAVIFIISLIGLYYFWYRHLAPPGTLRTVDGPKPAAGDTPPASRTTP